MEPWITVSTATEALRADGRDGAARFEPARLDGFVGGFRFGVWWLPADRDPRGSILCVQPIGEEHALARHAIAAQAWRMAALGWAVLLLDLYGCGDSPGEAAQATLEGWRNDLLRAAMISRQRSPGPHVLWGIRAGALLAVDIAVALDQLIDAQLFWQPCESGAGLAQALPPSTGFSPRMLSALGELQMQPPPTAERGSPPAVLFLEAGETAQPRPEVTAATRRIAEAWLAAGYLADARAVSAITASEPPPPGTAVPAAMFDATEEFLESVH